MPDDILTPEMTRELAALDAALAGEPVDPDLADLGELTALLREERPAPDPEFGRALDLRVKRGFPRGVQGRAVPSARGAARLRTRLTAFRTPLALGAAATVIIASVVGLSQLSIDSNDNGSSGSRGGSVAAAPAEKQSASESAGAASGQGQADSTTSVAPSVAPQSSGSPRTDARSRRFVERTAELTLAPRPADLDGVADGVVRVTDQVKGFVASSSVTSRREANFELRIPSDQLQRALSDLSRLAHVRERTQATEDITSTVVSTRDRLENARAERAGLLRRLAKATTDAQTAAIKARLRLVSRRIAAAKASLSRSENRARYATVSVYVVADRSAGSAGGGSWTPGDALKDAGRILEVAAGVVVVAGAALLPVALIGLLAWLAGRRTVRRRREAALDAL